MIIYIVCLAQSLVYNRYLIKVICCCFAAIFKKSRFVYHQMYFLLLHSCLDEALKPGISLLATFHSLPHYNVLKTSQTSLTTRLLLEESPDNGHS